jgi:hypothetical protein
VSATLAILELIYHNAAHHVRKQHRNAVLAVLTSILQSVATVAVFYIMFSILGIRGAAIRGDFLLYIMSGVFMFFTHVKAITPSTGRRARLAHDAAPADDDGHRHRLGRAVGALRPGPDGVRDPVGLSPRLGPITIYDPAGAMGMLILAWFSGVAIGMLFLGLKPWAPGLRQHLPDDSSPGRT